MDERLALSAGVTAAAEGVDGKVWRILGQTYTPKLVAESAMIWHAEVPADAFVPPHIHPTQDEWILGLEGRLDVEFGPTVRQAGPGDLVRMPRGVAHGVFNRSGAPATCIFGVSPTRRLFELFNAIHDVPDPAEVVRLSALHEVDFLPPPS